MKTPVTYLLTVLVVLILPHGSWANVAEDFFKTFAIERGYDGKIKKIYLKRGNARRLTFDDVAESFTDEILAAQNEIKQFDERSFIENNFEIQDWPIEQRQQAEKTLRLLKQQDLQAVIKDKSVTNAINYLLESGESETFNFRVLAVPENPRYYDSNETALRIGVKASGLINLAAGGAFGVSAALFLVSRTFDMILERRSFFQNCLIYYFDKYGPERFGVSKFESQKILSSIYESRIKVWHFWERKRARLTWDKYGFDKYSAYLVDAEKRRKTENQELVSWGSRMGFAFHDGENRSGKKIVNLVTHRSVMSKKLSYGFDYTSPNKLRNLRLLYFLMQIGVRFAPVPGSGRVFDFFVESLYVPQRQMEGMLYGFLKDNGSPSAAHAVARQTINPFILLEVENKNL